MKKVRDLVLLLPEVGLAALVVALVVAQADGVPQAVLNAATVLVRYFGL